jgi:hypothetical protein
MEMAWHNAFSEVDVAYSSIYVSYLFIFSLLGKVKYGLLVAALFVITVFWTSRIARAC